MKKANSTSPEGRKGYGSLISMINKDLKRKHDPSKNSSEIQSKKQKATVTSTPTIKDISCLCDLHHGSYRIKYRIIATGKCFGKNHDQTRHDINSSNEIIQSNIPWKEMKEKTINKIKYFMISC